jgi:NTP pyrophosphatase (non-canonical NTP hydrolase)
MPWRVESFGQLLFDGKAIDELFFSEDDGARRVYANADARYKEQCKREIEMVEKTFIADPSPWQPMSDEIDLKHLGKLAEELNECGSAVARCIIQGIDEAEPSTGVVNREWLTKEIADVLANISLVIARFDLNEFVIADRVSFKKEHLKKWHNMVSAFQGDL